MTASLDGGPSHDQQPPTPTAGQSAIDETPELSQVVADVMTADTKDEPSLIQSGESPKAAPIVRKAAIPGKPISETRAESPAVQLRPVVTPPRPGHVVEFKEQQGLSPDKQPPAPSPIDDEAIFPLLPSTVPDMRTERHAPRPAGEPLIPPTLSSELAPRTALPADTTDKSTIFFLRPRPFKGLTLRVPIRPTCQRHPTPNHLD